MQATAASRAARAALTVQRAAGLAGRQGWAAVYVSTLHWDCAPEYTLNAMLAGTYIVAVVPMLQGAANSHPKAQKPIEVTLVGMVMVDTAEQLKKENSPIANTLDGMVMFDRAVQELKAELPVTFKVVGIVTVVMALQPANAEFATLVMSVEMTMSPLQHALDGVALFTQPVAVVTAMVVLSTERGVTMPVASPLV
jgi:D-aminopeptidase